MTKTRETIIATADTDKIVFIRHGEKMWTRTRYQNGMLVHQSRETTKNVEAEVAGLTDWNITREDRFYRA